MVVRRVTLLMVCAFIILLSAVAGLVIRQAQGAAWESTIWMNGLLVVVGLLILARASLGPSATVVADRCQRCGGRTFETSRSSDRRQVRTCFSCGAENLSPGAAAPTPPPEPPREPPAYSEHLVRGEKQ